MKSFYIVILSVLLMACEDNELNVDSFLSEIPADEYYQEEIIPPTYSDVYGIWKISSVFGGIAAIEHEPEFDYLELKKVGIYGIIKNSKLVDYGKIEIDTTVVNELDGLVLKFVSLSPSDKAFDITLFPKIVNLDKKDSLELISACCDGFNYYFVKAD